jgi:transcriptional regulator with XRE-family HTH domain
VPKRQQLPVFSRRLREARELAGLSQRNLGIEAGLDDFVASTRVNRYETGVHQPDLQTLERLAQVLDVPVAYLYAEDDQLAAVILRFHRGNKTLREKVAAAAGDLK